MRLARARLRAARQPGADADAEDAALSALDSFFAKAACQGAYPRLADRNDLWPLLVLITARKAADRVHRDRAQKRGGGRVRAASDLPDPDDAGPGVLERIVGPEPSPEFAAQVAEECRRRLDALPDETLRRVALWKLEGRTNDEIAALLGRSKRTVAYKLELIRLTWEEPP